MSVPFSVPKRFDLGVFLDANDPGNDKETKERELFADVRRKKEESERGKFVDFEVKANEFEARIGSMESKLQRIYKKIDKKRGKIDTDDIQKNISNMTQLAFQYSDDCELYRQDIDDLNADISKVKENIVKLEAKYLNCERQLQDEFMLEYKRKQNNEAQKKVGGGWGFENVSTPNSSISLEAEIGNLEKRLREINHESNKNDVAVVNLEAQKRILDHRNYSLNRMLRELTATDERTLDLLNHTQMELGKLKEVAQKVRNERKAKDYLLKVAQNENNEQKNERDVLKSQVVMLEQKVVGISMRLVTERALFVDITSQTLFADRKVAEYDKLIQIAQREISEIEEKCKILAKGGYEAERVFKKEAEDSSSGGGSGNNSGNNDGRLSKKIEKKSFKDFKANMKAAGMLVVEVEVDNDSLFRAVSHQLCMSENRYSELRKKCIEHINKHRIRFSKLTSVDIDEYVHRLSLGAPADDLEIFALEEIIDRVILIYSRDSINGDVPTPMNVKSRDIAVMNSNGRFDAPLKICSIADEFQYHSVSDKRYPLPLPPRKSTSLFDYRVKIHESS